MLGTTVGVRTTSRIARICPRHCGSQGRRMVQALRGQGSEDPVGADRVPAPRGPSLLPPRRRRGAQDRSARVDHVGHYGRRSHNIADRAHLSPSLRFARKSHGSSIEGAGGVAHITHELHFMEPPEAAAMPGTRQTLHIPLEPSAGDFATGRGRKSLSLAPSIIEELCLRCKSRSLARPLCTCADRTHSNRCGLQLRLLLCYHGTQEPAILGGELATCDHEIDTEGFMDARLTGHTSDGVCGWCAVLDTR